MSAYGSRPDVRDRVEVTTKLFAASWLGRVPRPQGLPLVAASQLLAKLLGVVASHRQLDEEARGWRCVFCGRGLK
jgi:hypothetical protein